ncbi:MAG: tetratricopeptide repeat protein, partial [Candidatus Deferrimicrobium sp.]
RKAAEQGDAHAQFNLGVVYGKGEEIPQNDTEAVKWYRKAADQGFPLAQYILGSMYALGRGVPQDYVLAHMWYNLAALGAPPSDTNERSATVNYSEAVLNRDRVASLMTPPQIAEAQRMAQEWKPKIDLPSKS